MFVVFYIKRSILLISAGVLSSEDLCFRSAVSARDSGAGGAVSYLRVSGGRECDFRGEGRAV